jgi:hypothetical protein
MDSTVIYVSAAAIGLLAFALPFLFFLGLGAWMGLDASDGRLLGTYILAALVVSFAAAMGAFALIQQQNCKTIQMKQVASNAALAFGIQAITLLLVWFFPSLREIVTNVLPADSDPVIKTSIGYGFFSFWAAMYGITLGGGFSAVCPAATH